MQTAVSVKTMRESDAATIKSGIEGKELMLRAGKGVLESYAWKGPVAIVCGSGNNAGDGYVLALLLQERGIPCTVFLLFDRFSEDGRFYYDQCVEKGICITHWQEEHDFSEFEEIVDCIFGTGFCGEVQNKARAVIEAINQSRKTVISVDINSGLNGDSGTASLCVKSDLTVSIGFYKSGHFLNQAKDVIGRLCNVDIGIDLYGASYFLAEQSDFTEIFGERLQDSHKGAYGYVGILGGCREYAGAVKLANLSASALRAGAGVATLIVPQSLSQSVSPYLLESTLATMPDCDGKMIADLAKLDAILAGKKALAVGMGWGTSPDYAILLEHILRTKELSLVIDADGLNTLATMDQSLLKTTRCRVLLTPHCKEFERLSRYSVEEIRKDPIGCATSYALQNRVCLLLKGPCTVVTDGNETILVNRGCAGMATAGSGDVLSGILAGLLGYAPLSPLTAACGAYVAGLAGELAQAKTNPVSMVASDTVSKISEAVSILLQKKRA